MSAAPLPLLDWYDAAHQEPRNRAIHHLAHAIGFIGLVSWPVRWWLMPTLVTVAFLLSWAGHFAFERNVPAFFEPPTAGYPFAGVVKKVRTALGGLVWSARCLLRALK